MAPPVVLTARRGTLPGPFPRHAFASSGFVGRPRRLRRAERLRAPRGAERELAGDRDLSIRRTDERA